MTSKVSLEQTISHSLLKRYQPCPELQNFLANNKKLKVPIIADMLRAIPWESQRYLIDKYREHIPQVEIGLFSDIAAEWFSSGKPNAEHSRYALIFDLKGMLKEWGFHDFYEKHKGTLSVNMNDELFNQLNIYYCLDELFESHMNKIHEMPHEKKASKGVSISSDVSDDPKLSMISATQKTFFFTAMLTLQMKWMLELMDLAYIDGTMKASLDSEEYEKFEKMHQSMKFSTVDELVDIIEMFPPHSSKESTAALRLLLKNAENEIMRRVSRERKKIIRKKV